MNDPTLSLAHANVGEKRTVALENPDDIVNWNSDWGSYWKVYAIYIARGQLRLEKIAPPEQAEAEVERLRTEQDTFLSGHVATLRAEVERWKGLAHEENQQRSMLGVEVERLRAVNRELIATRHTAESSLAAANALLARARKLVHGQVGEAIKAHLAAQPATVKGHTSCPFGRAELPDADRCSCCTCWKRDAQPATARAGCEEEDGSPCDVCGKACAWGSRHPTCKQTATAPTVGEQALEGARDVLRELNPRVVTEAEQRVLDAMSAIPEDSLAWCDGISVTMDDAIKAELARRGLK